MIFGIVACASLVCMTGAGCHGPVPVDEGRPVSATWRLTHAARRKPVSQINRIGLAAAAAFCLGLLGSIEATAAPPIGNLGLVVANDSLQQQQTVADQTVEERTVVRTYQRTHHPRYVLVRPYFW